MVCHTHLTDEKKLGLESFVTYLTFENSEKLLKYKTIYTKYIKKKVLLTLSGGLIGRKPWPISLFFSFLVYYSARTQMSQSTLPNNCENMAREGGVIFSVVVVLVYVKIML